MGYEMRARNFVLAFVDTELGCDVMQGEYNFTIAYVANGFEVDAPRPSVPEMAKEAFDEWLNDPALLPPEGRTLVLLKEASRFEPGTYSWDIWYEVEHVTKQTYCEGAVSIDA